MKTKQTESFSESNRSQKKLIFRRRRLAVLFVCAILLFSVLGVNLFNNGRHLLKLQDYQQKVTKQQVKVNQTKNQLETEIRLLNDKEYVAKLARSKYLYSREGEQVYSIPGLSHNE